MNDDYYYPINVRRTRDCTYCEIQKQVSLLCSWSSNSLNCLWGLFLYIPNS